MTNDNDTRTDRVLEHDEVSELWEAMRKAKIEELIATHKQASALGNEIIAYKDERIAWLEERLAARTQYTARLEQALLTIVQAVKDSKGNWRTAAVGQALIDVCKIMEKDVADAERKRSQGVGDGC
jgi:hypothetical protein